MQEMRDRSFPYFEPCRSLVKFDFIQTTAKITFLHARQYFPYGDEIPRIPFERISCLYRVSKQVCPSEVKCPTP